MHFGCPWTPQLETRSLGFCFDSIFVLELNDFKVNFFGLRASQRCPSLSHLNQNEDWCLGHWNFGEKISIHRETLHLHYFEVFLLVLYPFLVECDELLSLVRQYYQDNYLVTRLDCLYCCSMKRSNLVAIQFSSWERRYSLRRCLHSEVHLMDSHSGVSCLQLGSCFLY